MTTYSATLLKTAPTIREGTLTLPLWGEFHIVMELLDREHAALTVTQGDAVWRGRLSLCREDTDDFIPGPWFWHSFLAIGRPGGWTFRVSGHKRGDDLVLEWDDTAKQPYTGPRAKVDSEGRVIP